MGAGHLKAFNVGGIARRWEYLVAGTPLSQIERSADLAQPGDVLITPEAHAMGVVARYVTVEPVMVEKPEDYVEKSSSGESANKSLAAAAAIAAAVAADPNYGRTEPLHPKSSDHRNTQCPNTSKLLNERDTGIPGHSMTVILGP